MSSALLVIDVQNGFINPASSHIPSKIRELITYHDYEHRIFTRFVNHSGSPFERLLNWQRLKTSPEIDIVSTLSDVPSIVIDKPFYTCTTPAFINYIKEYDINEFHIVGIDTDICVLKSAVDLFEMNLTPYVLTECCMSHAGKYAHEAALEILPRFIGRNQLINNYKAFLASNKS